MGKGRRDRGEGGLYRRADGSWVGAVEIPTTDGKRRRATVSSKRYDVAAQKLRKLRREVEDGTFAASGNTTVAQWCDRWLEAIVFPRVRPKTFRHYEQCVRLYIKPTVGKKRLSKLTQQHVREMHATLQQQSTHIAAKAHRALQKALKDAVREGLIARNVAELVDKPKHLARSYGSLTAQAALHLINTAVDRGDTLASLWAVSFYTGARPGELLGLEWDRVDFEAGVIDLAWQLQYMGKAHGCGIPQRNSEVSGSGEVYPCGRRRPGHCPQGRFNFPPGFEYRELQGSLVLTRPKTKAGTRVVPLARPVAAMLRARRAATADQHNPLGLVWHDPAGYAIDHRGEHHAWVAACEAAGLARRKPSPPIGTCRRCGVELRRVDDTHVEHAAPTDCTRAWVRGGHARRAKVEWEVRPPAPYVSRHTAATLFQEAGVPEDVRMSIMGHSSIVAHRGYVHTLAGPKRQAVAALEGVLDVEVDEDIG